MTAGVTADDGRLSDTVRLILAGLIPLVAFVLQWTFWAAIQPYVWFLFFPAVFFSSWIGGKRAGLAATAFSTMAVWWFFIPERFSFALERSTSAFSIVIFAGMGVVFSLTHDRLRKANQQAADALAAVIDARDQLEERVSLRTAELGQTVVALRASEEKYQLIAETAEDWIYWIAPDGKFPFISPSCERMTGYSMLEFTSNPQLITEMVHPEDRVSFLPHSENIIHESKPDYLEFRIITKTGEILWIGHCCVPIYNMEGKYAGRRGTNRNITERKQAEERILAQATLLDSAQDAIMVRSDADEIIYWNEGAMKTYGWTQEEVMGQVTHTLLQTRFPKPLAEIKAEIAERGLWEGELTHVCKSGREIVVNSRWVLNKDNAGSLTGTLEINRDITELKLAEKALRERDEQFRTLANSMPNLAWWANGDGYITWYNRRWYEYTGTTPEQMEGWGWQSVHDPEMLPLVMERWTASIATGELFDMEFPLRGADGVFRTFLTRMQPVRDSAGQVIRWFGTNTDITELKQSQEVIRRINEELEGRVRERTAQLEAVNKELEAFSYSVAHDLRAPLRAVDGYTRILIEEYESRLDAEGKRICSVISESAKDMGKLIDDLLAFSRVGRAVMSSSVINMETMARSIFFELTNPESRERIDFRVGPLPSATGDTSLIRQVWMNLLSNAVKFSSKKELAIIEVSAERSADEIVYSIRDNGAGFDMQYMDKLFGVFQRLHSTKEFEGTGVGLAIVHRIILRHGGRIWAEGETGKGATFHFTFRKGE
jgi:PAS domain S-box-containing protein